MEPLRRVVLAEPVGEPETLIVDSTLLSVLHPKQGAQSEGFEGATWVMWGSFSVYGVKLHLLLDQPRAHLLRTDGGEHRGCTPRAGAAGRSLPR
jgi:hypothetical protein